MVRWPLKITRGSFAFWACSSQHNRTGSAWADVWGIGPGFRSRVVLCQGSSSRFLPGVPPWKGKMCVTTTHRSKPPEQAGSSTTFCMVRRVSPCAGAPSAPDPHYTYGTDLGSQDSKGRSLSGTAFARASCFNQHPKASGSSKGLRPSFDPEA